MNKPVRVFFINDAQVSYTRLVETVGEQIREEKENTKEMQLLRSINQKKEFIKANPFYGDNVEKKKIPGEYHVTNLWRVELTNYWRMLYTIKGDQIEIICFIIDVMDHQTYNKKFGYRER